MKHLCLVPDPEGLEKTKQFYREKVGRELTDEEAITELAEKFQVSKQAMSLRLASLGIFEETASPTRYAHHVGKIMSGPILPLSDSRNSKLGCTLLHLSNPVALSRPIVAWMQLPVVPGAMLIL